MSRYDHDNHAENGSLEQRPNKDEGLTYLSDILTLHTGLLTYILTGLLTRRQLAKRTLVLLLVTTAINSCCVLFKLSSISLALILYWCFALVEKLKL